MTLINTTQAIRVVAELGHFFGRVHQLQQDPAAQKAWSDAARNVAEACTSVSTAVSETRSAWRRTGTGGAYLYA